MLYSVIRTIEHSGKKYVGIPNESGLNINEAHALCNSLMAQSDRIANNEPECKCDFEIFEEK